MSALLGLTLLASLAGDPGVVARPRPEAAWAAVVAAAPASELSAAERLLFAALVETPEAWPDGGALRLAHARGASVEATALADGLIVRIEGHADDVKLLMEAARACRLLPKPTPTVLARAQGSILRDRLAARGLDVGHDAMWQRWFGDRSPSRALEVDDIALHRVTPAAFWSQYEAWAKETTLQLFVEGRLPATLAHTDPVMRAAAPALLPVVDEGPRHVHGAVAAPQLLLAHPLPPSEANATLAVVLEEALESAAAEGAPPIVVDVLTSRRSALLVLKAPLSGQSPEAAREAIDKQLVAALEALGDTRGARTIVSGASARMAGRDRVIGDRVAREARAWLTDSKTTEDPAAAATALIFPDALRMIVVHPYGAALPN